MTKYRLRKRKTTCYVTKTNGSGFRWAKNEKGTPANSPAESCLLASVVASNWDGVYTLAYRRATGKTIPQDLAMAISHTDSGGGTAADLVAIIREAAVLGVPLVVSVKPK